jgi:hypothetical protein
MKEKNYEFLKNIAASRGADLFGVADTKHIEKYIYEELKNETDKMPPDLQNPLPPGQRPA